MKRKNIYEKLEDVNREKLSQDYIEVVKRYIKTLSNNDMMSLFNAYFNAEDKWSIIVDENGNDEYDDKNGDIEDGSTKYLLINNGDIYDKFDDVYDGLYNNDEVMSDLCMKIINLYNDGTIDGYMTKDEINKCFNKNARVSIGNKNGKNEIEKNHPYDDNVRLILWDVLYEMSDDELMVIFKHYAKEIDNIDGDDFSLISNADAHDEFEAWFGDEGDVFLVLWDNTDDAQIVDSDDNLFEILNKVTVMGNPHIAYFDELIKYIQHDLYDEILDDDVETILSRYVDIVHDNYPQN